MMDEGAPAVVIAAAAALPGVMAAADLGGVRVARTLDWESVPAELGRQAARAMLVVEADGISDDRLVAAMPAIARHAAATDAAVVVSFSADQIDVVTAGLAGPRVQWLCDPSMAERVGAIAIAREPGVPTSLHDVSRQTEAVRLQRLNEEVARIADVLSRLTREEPARIADHAHTSERQMSFGAQPIVGEPGVSAAEIRQAIRSRRMRDQFFRPGLFEDPAWDMLLDLFAAELEHAQVSVSSLCIAAAVAPTTALRWIGKLSDGGLVVREPDPFDRRRAFMALSETARAGMRAYCQAAKKSGLAIA